MKLTPLMVILELTTKTRYICLHSHIGNWHGLCGSPYWNWPAPWSAARVSQRFCKFLYKFVWMHIICILFSCYFGCKKYQHEIFAAWLAHVQNPKMITAMTNENMQHFLQSLRGNFSVKQWSGFRWYFNQNQCWWLFHIQVFDVIDHGQGNWQIDDLCTIGSTTGVKWLFGRQLISCMIQKYFLQESHFGCKHYVVI